MQKNGLETQHFALWRLPSFRFLRRSREILFSTQHPSNQPKERPKLRLRPLKRQGSRGYQFLLVAEDFHHDVDKSNHSCIFFVISGTKTKTMKSKLILYNLILQFRVIAICKWFAFGRSIVSFPLDGELPPATDSAALDLVHRDIHSVGQVPANSADAAWPGLGKSMTHIACDWHTKHFKAKYPGVRGKVAMKLVS